MSIVKCANLNWPMLFFGIVILFSTSQCATMREFENDAWVSDYDSAEKRVTQSQLPLLIYYSDTIPTAPNPSQLWENDESIKPLLNKYICCRLYRQSAFDRRYVAQFGITRAPAVIVVRLDGTHHAKEGIRLIDQLRQFLKKADGPGQPSVQDPHIVRRAEYDWVDNIASARRIAQDDEKPLLVVYVKRFSRDWSRIKNMLHHHMVSRHLRDVVMCRIDVNAWANDVYISEFGVVTLPTIVLEANDGSHVAIQQPTDFEMIAMNAAKMFQKNKAKKVPSHTTIQVQSR